jgi:hypothetical protein
MSPNVLYLGNRCSIRLSYGTKQCFQQLSEDTICPSLTIASHEQRGGYGTIAQLSAVWRHAHAWSAIL